MIHLLRLVSASVALGSLLGCGQPDPALRVGVVGFTEEQISGLTGEQEELLADLASVGQIFAQGKVDSIVAPLAAREAHRSRLGTLPYLLAAEEAGIGEDSLRRVYAAAPEWELSVRHVVLLAGPGAEDARRVAALERAREAERRARGGEDFAAIAAELSEEPGAAERGGLLSPGREGSWVAPFWAAASALEPGEVSPVIETEYGYHVLRLEDRRPVPFEEATMPVLLRRVTSPDAARRAMEAWASARPPVALDPPSVLSAREALATGAALDTLDLARSDRGGVYTGRDLALTWAMLAPDRRRELEDLDDASFGGWLANDVRERFWADEAERLGAEPARGVSADAGANWRARIERIAEGQGVHAGAGPESIAAAALSGIQAGGQEGLITRSELPGLRPLLRSVVPVKRSQPEGSGS